MSRVLTITLPGPYPLLNRTLRLHHAVAAKQKRAIRWNIVASLGGPTGLPETPFQRAHIRVERWSTGTPDHDNLVGGAKPIIDCLTTPQATSRPDRPRNKYGLGIVVDDSPAHVTTEYRAVKCRHNQRKTVVTVTDLTGDQP